MLVYEYKLDASPAQYARIDEAIRVGQFVRNKCLRLWMDSRGVSAHDLQVFCSRLANDYAFAARLNSQARQAAADRAWQAISRFYANCREQRPGKKGYPQFRQHCRSVEYKHTGWKLDPDGRHLTFTDGCGIGRVRLVGTREIATERTATTRNSPWRPTVTSSRCRRASVWASTWGCAPTTPIATAAPSTTPTSCAVRSNACAS